MTLTYDVAGAGTNLLFLHSGVCDRRMWDPQWSTLLDAGFRLIRCDFRGFGESPVPDRSHSDAEDVRDLLDALDVDRVVIVGSSFGGRVALEVAARWPDRVTALALLCSALSGQERSPELSAFNAREDELISAGDIAGATDLNVETWLGPDTDAATREQVRRMQRHAFDVQLAAEEEFAPLSAEFELAAVQARCLAVSGAHDLPDFRQIAAKLPTLLPDAQHVELPWAGHLPSLERPAETTKLLTDFLRRPSDD
ncbi:alpha/beta fold hydrolase [Actinoplanes sp. NPDC051859]|uniref:alpha/beta fold hydrolase n=1 Tax=Actinoplanes sp. NPDC051859 TaxID=3363909 RepID=UPI0037956573